MKSYNREQKDWPHFKYSLTSIEDLLLAFSQKTGRVSGILESVPDETRQDVLIDLILTEAIKTSQIEGEFPDRRDVLSSIRRNLGLITGKRLIRDKSAEGLGQLMIDVRKTYKEALTFETLFDWHKMLMSSSKRVRAGAWRVHKDPMQVVSGVIGKEEVHFEAPPSTDVPKEMRQFVKWFNNTAPGGRDEIKRAPVRSAIAHLYFETIHPFEDGNGRIGRAIAEKALSQAIGQPVMLSLSRTIESDKKLYYQSLKEAQRSNEITPWILYFSRTILQAQEEAEKQVEFTLKKVKLFDRFNDRLNARQAAVVKRMLEHGPGGFEGGMNARKYMVITKTSKATATRDMQELAEMGVFGKRVGGGRSTAYDVVL